MQINFEGKTKEQVAIERLKTFEPLEGYYLTHSYGKDSDCTLELCKLAGVRYDVHYSLTGIDPPEAIWHGRKYHPEIIIDKPEMSIFRAIEKKGLPTRIARWCCELLKEGHGEGRFVITGIRGEESARRRHRGMVETCRHGRGKKFLHPIIDWTTTDVWQFIREHNLPYCSLYDEGWKRIGCIGCPMSSNRDYQFDRYPKIRDAWYRATERFFYSLDAERKRTKFKSPQELWDWWLQDKSVEEFTKDLPMFA